ncbi:MAG: hypothetical protein ACRDJW_23660 [Thermomicrobiales bacterium]
MADNFDWKEYLRLARQLVTDASDEAALRSNISRAYYSAYHRTTIVCRERTQLPLRGHRIWGELATFGRNNNLSNMMLIGELGIDLKRHRIIADYHNPYNRDNRVLPPLKLLATDAIAQAHAILRLLDQIAAA